MKPTLYGTMNLAFAHRLKHDNEKLAFDETMIESVKVQIKNIHGEVVEINAEDWFVRIEDIE